MLRGAYADNLSWQHAGDSLLMTVLGGVHHFLGPLWGAIAFILLEDRLSAITESWWLIFAPIVMVFALASPEGMQGLVFRLLGRNDWTLTRRGMPPRPASIEPWRGGAERISMPPKPMLEVRNLHKRFGSLVVAQEVNLDVHPFRLHSLIGPNGAGKTTFFNMLTGLLRADAGAIRFDGHDITQLPVHRRIRLGVSRSFQILSVFRNLTDVRECARRRAGAEPAAELAVARRLRHGGASTRAPGRCLPRWGWRIVRPNLAPIFRTANSVCWRSPSRSPPMRSCCCWTSRWPAWRKRTARWSER